MHTWSILYDAQGLSTAQTWAGEFKRRQKSLEDDPRSGQPTTAITPEIIDHVHQIVIGDRRLAISHKAKKFSLSCDLVENILHKELGLSKVSA